MMKFYKWIWGIGLLLLFSLENEMMFVLSAENRILWSLAQLVRFAEASDRASTCLVWSGMLDQKTISSAYRICSIVRGNAVWIVLTNTLNRVGERTLP